MQPSGVVLVQEEEEEIAGNLDLQELVPHAVVDLFIPSGQEELVSNAASKDIRSIHVM